MVGALWKIWKRYLILQPQPLQKFQPFNHQGFMIATKVEYPQGYDNYFIHVYI